MRVAEKKKDGRIGIVRASAGKGLWEVQFDGEDGTEEKPSKGALRIAKELYGKVKTPSKPARSVRAASPKTGRRQLGSKATNTSDSSSASSSGSNDN